MKVQLILGAAILALAGSPVFAQPVQEQTTVVKEKPATGAATGAVTGAAAGAAVAGPVGAAVGAGVGAVVGIAAPPKEVRTYVTTHNVPPVTYGRSIVVGHPLEGEISWLEVPGYSSYRWAYVDGRRVVVDANSHNVVAVYEADPPAGVRSYVTGRTAPVIKYGHPLVVGSPVAGEIAWLDVPNYPKFRWAYVDGQRVVIDTDTNTVVALY